MLFRLSVCLTALCFASAALAESKTHTLSGENTKVEFVGAKKDGKHTGGFKTISGTAVSDGTDPTKLELTVTIKTDSIYSDDDKLTAHLKNPDFFEVKKFPEAKFVSSGIAKAKTGSGYVVTGDLTMHGETAEISFPAEIAITADGLVKLSAKFNLDRTKWKMTYGKGNIEDNVAMTISIAPKK